MTTCAFADALTDRAKQLLRDRQHREAYNLLLPQEPSRAGDPEFDYLLGIAAIDAGDPERGIFALERVLAVQPNNHVARAEIARAYLAVGERDAARREFETVRRQQIPEDAKTSIDRYLSAIASADVTQIRGYLEAGFGYDSNVNSATSNSQIAVPTTGGPVIFDITSGNQRRDHFLAFAGGLNFTRKVSPAFALIGGASANAKSNIDEGQFDTYNFDLNLGGRMTSGKNAFTLAAQFQEFGVDVSRYREAAGVVAQWQHNYHERRQATLFAQFTDLNYPTQSIRDAERSVLGIAYGTAIGGSDSVMFVSGYGGQESEKADGVPHLGHDLVGIRIGGQMRLGTGIGAFANASHERRLYGGTEPIFLVRREDRQYDVAVGISYLISSATTLVTQLSYTRNDSNVVLNDYDRTMLSLAVRYNF
jgi:outer membrane protein